MKQYIKSVVAVFTCLSLMMTLLSVSGISAFADDDEDDRKYITESDWNITIPQIYIYTEDENGLSLLKEDGYVDSEVFVKDVDGSILSGEASFKVRGNTTSLSWIRKKPFTFKFSKKKNVLGMGSGKKWALIANAFDPTLLRNYVAFDFAQHLGLAYTSQQKFVELWVDGSYRGLYTLYEPVQEGKDRVNIDIESNGGKKDFLIEYESMRVEDDTTYFTVDGQRFIASDPDEPDEEQLGYIKSTMTDIINTMKNGTRAEIEEAIDVDSFAKFYLLNEYLKTFDFSVSSVYFYYKDGKLFAGPPWDYDLSAGNNAPDYSTRAANADKTDGLFAANKNLYRYLSGKEWFNAEVKNVYLDNKGYLDNLSADGGLLDALREQYSAELARNFTVHRPWDWWLNNQKQPYSTYEENYQYLKNWYRERNEWLGSYLTALPDAYKKGDTDGDGTVTITDATILQRILADFETDDAATLTRRGRVLTGTLSIKDVTAIQRYLAEYDNEYKIGEYV